MNKTPEGFNLFNPSFCGLVLCSTIASYSKLIERGLSYPLLFLILPTVLHEETRMALPKSGRMTLHAWLQGHSFLRIGFSERCNDLLPTTTSAVSFLLARNVITFSDGMAKTPNIVKVPKDVELSNEMKQILKSADVLGKLFAGSGSVGTTFSTFGVRP